jgi:exonuclease VII small subunit
MATPAETQATPDYSKFTILLDDPALKPKLGFDVYANALAQIVALSPPQFAVGIFGDWGSGKTTLMRAIEERIAAQRDTMLPVRFNAWRYEREEHLIVPLLDHLREALLEWRNDRRGDQGARKRAGQAASKFGRASRALARGLTFKAGVPGLEATLALDKVVPAPGPRAGPASFYHAAFRDMRDATETFAEKSGDAPESAKRRIVVFVDDLDRCLPANALQVLESMKLFFDLAGFVFVVGLDQSVIERAIEAKYESGAPPQMLHVIERPPANQDVSTAPATRTAPATDRLPAISGADYVKKIFQVPFALPRIGTASLRELVDALSETLSPPQRADLATTVRHHLLYMTDRDSLNPREVKRLINAYTLQMKLLQPLAGEPVSPDTVLAIQLIGFRADWQHLYDALVDEPAMFARDMKDVIDHDRTEMLVGDRREPIPPGLLAYFRGPAKPLLTQPSLTRYVSSAEQTSTTGRGSLEARRAVRRLKDLFRTAIEQKRLDNQSAVLEEIGGVRQLVSSISPDVSTLEKLVSELEEIVRKVEPSAKPDELVEALERGRELLDRMWDTLTELRRQASLGPS